MRILQAFQPPIGGLAVHVRHLTEGLVARGHEVVVTGPADAHIRAPLEAAGVRYETLPWLADVPAPGPDRRVLGGLRELVSGVRPDVVHAHGQKAGLLARPVARRAGVASVYTPHSLVYRTQMARPRRAQRARYLVHRQVERWLGARTEMLAACARDEADTAVRDGLLPRERTCVVEYGVDVDLTTAAAPELLSVPGDGPLFGIVSTLRDQKGLPWLLEALEQLHAEGRPVRFAVVGEGDMRDEVARRIAGGPLRETTRLVDFGGRVEPYLAALDVFVLPSLWEGMPISVLESMTFGLPVVATAVFGTPEAVEDGRTGILVPPRDAPALAEAMGRMAADAGLRERMGAAGREAAKRFTVDRSVEATLVAYERALKAR